MKTLTLLFAFAVAISSPAFAGKKAAAAKGAGKEERPVVALKQYDKNGNGQIDGDEVAALKEAIAKADAKDPLKAKLDHNGNGQLDDNELAAINKRLGKHGERAAKKAKKSAV
jgi:Ca2+-binding EF-hand superfamily protein